MRFSELLLAQRVAYRPVRPILSFSWSLVAYRFRIDQYGQ